MAIISAMNRFALKARFVFPVVGPPIVDGIVTIEGQRIVSIGHTTSSNDLRNLGNVAILPGLVNAHTHLDFCNLTNPLGRPGTGMAEWIRLVREYRCRPGAIENAIPAGLQESLRYGVTTVGDITQPDQNILEYNTTQNINIFWELIAPTAGRASKALQTLNRYKQQEFFAGRQNLLSGLSPHAPYSVHPMLLDAVISLAQTCNLPVAMHLAESREEIELLQSGSGPLRAFLEEIGAWDSTVAFENLRPIDYLRHLAKVPHVLIIHGNYLDEEEIAFLARHHNVSVVYCPRTYQWFQHGTYPLEKLLSAGINVALGTDSRASSPDLNLLAEMRTVVKNHPSVELHQVLAIGTLAGARALGWQEKTGALLPGKQADLAIVALPDRDAADPHELLFYSEEPVVSCYCRGQLCS